jgi:preprotein translocase subunit SecY
MANPIQNLLRAPELKQKILFTLLCLGIYRLGAHITVPGVDVVALGDLAASLQGTLFGLYDMFVGGGLQRATIFALGIMPYISASIMFQLLAAVFPTIEKMQKEGEEGRKRLNQWTRYTTVLLCVLQGYGYAIFLESQSGVQTPIVPDPGWAFRLMTVLTLTTGGVFIMWLGEQITERGIGNGMSLLIFFSILEGFPNAVARTFEALTVGTISTFKLVTLLAVMVGVIAGRSRSSRCG